MTLQQFIDKYNGKKVEYHSYSSGALYQLLRPVFKLCKLSCFYSLIKCIKRTKINNLVIDSNVGIPNPIDFFIIPISHTRVAALIIGSNSPISYISSIGNNTKIAASIIKSISINVVNILIARWLHYPAMQFLNVSIRKSFLKINKAIPLFRNTPLHAFELLQSLVVRVVNHHGIRSMFFARKSDIYHVLSLSNG
jgi:hypothetical protein